MPKPIQFALMFICLSALLLTAAVPERLLAASYDTGLIFQDALASNWNSGGSWGSQVDLLSQVAHTGSASISVTSTAAYSGLGLKHPGLADIGYTHIRLFLNGGAVGGQHLSVYLVTAAGAGPKFDIPSLAANIWTEYKISLQTLGAVNATVTALVVMNQANQPEPTFYLDDIALISGAEPGNPLLENGFVHPNALVAGDLSGIVVRVSVSDPQGLGDITSVALLTSGMN